MKKYFKLENITKQIQQYKLDEEPDIRSLEMHFKYLLKNMRLLYSEIENLMLYKTTEREETVLNLPDYLWLKKGRIPKDNIKFDNPGIEHTKINPYKNKKWGDPLRNPNFSFEAKTKGIINDSNMKQDLYIYKLNGIRGNEINKENLFTEIKKAIKKKTKKNYSNLVNFLWIEIDTHISLSIDGITFINSVKNRDLIKSMIFSINVEIIKKLEEDKFDYFQKFPISIITFKLKESGGPGVVSSAFVVGRMLTANKDECEIDYDRIEIGIELFDGQQKAEIIGENEKYADSFEIELKKVK